jgi:K+-transporting ATPase ATPase A chain
MTAQGWVEIAVVLALLLSAAWPLGRWCAAVLDRAPTPVDRVLDPVENGMYRLAGVDPSGGMGWGTYAIAVLLFNGLGALVVYGMQRTQGWLPGNPEHLGAVTADSAFNTAISFATNTNWQGYGGETTMSYLTQMSALGVQNFVSAATGIAVMAALARGLGRPRGEDLGNFWVDLIRTVTRILLPLSVVLALVLVSQGVVQTFVPYVHATVLDPVGDVNDQVLALGPAASQVAIKQLGTNGGGFFNVNSAHPFENPTPLTNLLECLAILLLPGALCVTWGRMVRDDRQGWALLAAMTVILVPCVVLTALAEQHAPGLSGVNLEGKEVRFAIAGSALWAVFTTAASNGSVNAMHDSFTPLGGLLPMWLIQLGEVVYGGVGSGLYGMILYVIITVFLAGLMVGHTPEYLGKKVEAFEMKMAAIGVLVPSACVLVGTAIALSTDAGRSTVFNTGPHGFSEVLYAFSSASNNNGSAFAGLGANTLFYNVALGIAMWLGRYAPLLAVLGVAGSMLPKKTSAHGPGTLPTHDALFVAMLVAVVLLIGALTFLPALSLGPIVEAVGSYS